MGRTPRRMSTTGIHHVMNRGTDHQQVFFADDDRVEFGRRLAAIHREHGVATLAYCLMDNHFHLVLRDPSDVLSDAMQHVASVYTRHTNDRLGRDGPLFRGRFHSIPVETDAYLVWVTRYIHLNPVGLPGVASPRDHRWSSYRTYLGLRAAPPFLDMEPVMRLIGGRRNELARLTEGPADRDPGPSSRVSGTPRATITPEVVRSIVACGVALDDLEHGEAAAGRRQLDRTVLVLLAGRVADPDVRAALVTELGPSTARAAREAVDRAERRLRSDPAVGRILRWVMGALATPAEVRAA